MKVVEAPPIQFTCDSCGARNEGDASEFRARHTMPPTWVAQCAFCRCESVCSPAPLIAALVGGQFANAHP